jgi:heptosyltransferase-1
MSVSGADAPIPSHQIIRISTFKRIASLLLSVVAVVLRFKNSFGKSNPQRVVVLEPVGLGDVITFVPLIDALLDTGKEVIVGSKPEWRAIFPDRPGQIWINTRVPWATHNEKAKYQFSRYFKEPTRGDVKQLRSVAKGSIGIETRGDIRSVILLYLAGCKRVISLSNYLGSDLRMPRAAAEIVPFDNDVRRWVLNARFLRVIDPSADLKRISPPRLSHLIRREPAHRIALIPVAPWAGKLWPADRWRSVSEALAQQDWELVVLCGPNQTGKAREQVGGKLPVCECGSVEQWAEQLNRCTLAISVDSGPMHLADAMEVPVIALYGQGKLPLWAPSGPASIVLAHQDSPDFFVCHPIDANIPLGQKFMNKITVEEVLQAVVKITSSRPSGSPSGQLDSEGTPEAQHS